MRNPLEVLPDPPIMEATTLVRRSPSPFYIATIATSPSKTSLSGISASSAINNHTDVLACSGSTIQVVAQERNKLQFVKPKDWEPNRELIGVLYKNYTLPEVMMIMEDEFSFKATAKMYKARLGKWGFDSKYRKRVGKRNNTGHRNHPERLSPRTPLKVSRITKIVVPRPEHSLTLAESDLPEKTIYIMNQYFTAGFEADLWYTDQDGDLRSRKGSAIIFNRATEFFDFIDNGISEISGGRFAEGKCSLIAGLAFLDQIIKADEPCFVEYLFQLLSEWILEATINLAMPVLRHIIDMYVAVGLQNHPIALFCEYIKGAPSGQRYHAILVVLETTKNIVAKALGDSHRFTTSVLGEIIILDRGERLQLEKTKQHMLDARRVLGVTDNRYLYLLRYYCNLLRIEGNHTEAIKIYERGLFCTETLPVDEGALMLGEYALALLWNGRAHDAIETLKEAIAIGEKLWGECDSWVLGCIETQACWLDQCGQCEVASEIRKEKRIRLDLIMANVMV